MAIYKVTITVGVYDEQKLIDAAKVAAKEDGLLDDEDVADFSVYDALRWLAVPDKNPPGTAINDVKAEKDIEE